jgi:hypothetical protein
VIFLAKENIAFAKYQLLIGLITNVGMKLNDNTSLYKSRYGFKDLFKAIHHVLTSTDISNYNHLISFLIFYDNKINSLRCELLDIDEMERGTSVAIFDSLRKSL